jgi:hypothetical protein
MQRSILLLGLETDHEINIPKPVGPAKVASKNHHLRSEVEKFSSLSQGMNPGKQRRNGSVCRFAPDRLRSRRAGQRRPSNREVPGILLERVRLNESFCFHLL